jgi:hypothetical protein
VDGDTGRLADDEHQSIAIEQRATSSFEVIREAIRESGWRRQALGPI